MTDTAQKELIADATGAVTGIALPKDKPTSPMRQVTFAPPDGWTRQYPPSGWMFADKLGDITIGDVVAYKVEKVGEYKNVTSIARVGEGVVPEEADVSTTPSPLGVDDSEQGKVDPSPSAVAPPSPAAVPNQDVARFESYAFLAACGMVDLAYEELSDAKNADTIEAVTPRLVHDVAAALLDAADAAQRQLVGHVNRNALSHTRARGAVRTALRSYRYEGETVDWGAALTKAAVHLLQVAASL